MKKHSVDRIIELESTVEELKSENLAMENFGYENDEMAEKLKTFDQLTMENEKLAMEVTKLKTKTLIFKRQIQKLSNSAPQENPKISKSLRHSLSLKTSPVEANKPFFGQSSNNLPASNKMEVDRICNKISGLIKSVKLSQIPSSKTPQPTP